MGITGVLPHLVAVILLVIGLLSGAFSVLRELQQMYWPAKAPSRSVFWNWVRIAFVFAAVILWIDEHSKVATGPVPALTIAPPSAPTPLVAELNDAKTKIDGLEKELEREKKLKTVAVPPVNIIPPPGNIAPVKLAFSLAPIEKGGKAVTEINAPMDANGSVTFTIYLVNQSGSMASNGMVWFRICQGCTYTYGPELFYHPPSAIKEETTDSFNRLFTNTHIVAKVGVAPPSGAASFPVELKYACENCESDTGFQIATIHIKR